MRADEITARIYECPIALAPSAILIDSNNKGYCRVVLDDGSIKFFRSNLHRIKNTTNRSYLWRILADQVKLLRLSPADFIEVVLHNLPNEDEELTLPFIFAKTEFVIKNYIESEDKQQVRVKYFEALHKKLLATTN